VQKEPSSDKIEISIYFFIDGLTESISEEVTPIYESPLGTNMDFKHGLISIEFSCSVRVCPVNKLFINNKTPPVLELELWKFLLPLNLIF